MEISPVILSKMLFVAFLFGAQAGIVFDVGRALRAFLFGDVKSKKIKRLYCVKLPFSKKPLYENEKKRKYILKNILIFLCDFFCVIYAFFGLVIINYSYNDGGMRAFTLVGAFVGFLLYYFTLSRLVLLFLELISFVLRFVFLSLFDAVRLPFSKLYANLSKKLKKSGENIRFRIEKKHKKVYNVCEVVCENTSPQNKVTTVKISARGSKQRLDQGLNEKPNNFN